MTDGAAARRREKRKEDKYQHERLPAGDVMSFVPLIFEHFGHWGEKAEGFLKELSKELTDEDGHSNTCEFVGYWRKCLSLQIQKCNAGMIFRKLLSLTELTDYDISSFSDMLVQSIYISLGGHLAPVAWTWLNFSCNLTHLNLVCLECNSPDI